MNKGIVFAIASSLTFSLMNVLVKLISETIPSSQIAFFRGAIGTLLILALMYWKGVKFSKTEKPLLLMRGAFGGLYMVTYFFAISTMKLGDASILVHLSGIFVMIFSAVFLKEKLPRSAYMIMPIIFIGAGLIINPFRYSTYSYYAIFGILSAVLAAAASVTIRQLARSKKHHNYEIVFYFLVASALVAIPLMWKDFVIPNTREFILLIMLSVVSLLAQLFLTSAFSHENAAVVSVVRYIGVFFNAMWGFVIWGEVLTTYSLIGCGMIIGSSILLSREVDKFKKQASENNKLSKVTT